MATSVTPFPYGVFNFKVIVEQGYFFIDNSEVIKELEDRSRKHVLLCRPPRFGKSLLLSMLSKYYDEQQAPLFDKLFGHLWIGQEGNKTDNRNKYKVLRVDLSGASSTSSEDGLKSITDSVNAAVEDFRARYHLNIVVDPTSMKMSLSRMATALEETSSRLLVLIDEYDRWANLLIDANALQSSNSESQRQLKDKLLPLRSFFENLKSLQCYDLPDFRTVTVGISVLPLADISGWNVYADLTHEGAFATALGFTEAGVRSALQALQVVANDQPTLLHLVRTYWNGYDFAGGGETVYNPQQVIRFCERYREKKLDEFVKDASACDAWSPQRSYEFILTCSDRNSLPSESVFEVAAASPYCTLQLMQSLAGVSETEPSRTMLPREALSLPFRLHDVMTSEVGLLRLMLHHGIVTLASADASGYGLRLPNRFVRRQHWEALMRRLEQEKDLLANFWRAPNADNLKQLLDSIVEHSETQIWSSQLNETTLQLAFEYALSQMCRTSSCRFKDAKVSAHVLSETREINLLLHLPAEHKLAIVELKRPVRIDVDLGSALTCAKVDDRSGANAAGEGEHAQVGKTEGDDEAKKRKNREARAGDRKGRNEVVLMSPEQLRALKLTTNARGKFGMGVQSVADVLDKAKEQTRQQEQALRGDLIGVGVDTIIYRFAVVQVIEPPNI